MVDVACNMAKTLYRWYPKQFEVDKIKHLLLDPATLEAIKADKSLEEIAALWKADRAEFDSRREKYLIYK